MRRSSCGMPGRCYAPSDPHQRQQTPIRYPLSDSFFGLLPSYIAVRLRSVRPIPSARTSSPPYVLSSPPPAVPSGRASAPTAARPGARPHAREPRSGDRARAERGHRGRSVSAGPQDGAQRRPDLMEKT